MANPREVHGMLVEKASIADFVTRPAKNYFVLVNYKFMRLLRVDAAVNDVLTPTVTVAEHDPQYAKPEDQQGKTQEIIMPNLEQCLFRLTPNA